MSSGKSGVEVWICDSCQKTVEEGKARQEGGILHCPDCGAELNTKIYVPTRRERAAALGQGASNFDVRMPPWMSEKEENGMLEISYLTRVAGSQNIPWDLGILALIALYLFQPRGQIGSWPWTFGAVIFVLDLILTVSGLFSRVRIQITRNQLRVARSFSLFGASSWKADEIRQLYSRERDIKDRFGRSRERRPGEPVNYELMLILEKGGEIPLLSGLKEMQAALYIERRIESLLDIPDMAVNSEIPY